MRTLKSEILQYLDEPQTQHLLEEAKHVNNLEELKNIVNGARILHNTYVHDAEFYIHKLEMKI